MKKYNYFWLIVLMVWITGCSENVISLESKVMENDQLEVVDMVFDENYLLLVRVDRLLLGLVCIWQYLILVLLGHIDKQEKRLVGWRMNML